MVQRSLTLHVFRVVLKSSESFMNGKAFVFDVARFDFFHLDVFFVNYLKLLHFSLPTEIYSIQNDKNQVQREVHYAIDNLGGTILSLYPPHMAFELGVRMQIAQLETPIVACVDLVVEELSNAVRNCTQHVSHSISYLQNRYHRNLL